MLGTHCCLKGPRALLYATQGLQIKGKILPQNVVVLLMEMPPPSLGFEAFCAQDPDMGQGWKTCLGQFRQKEL